MNPLRIGTRGSKLALAQTRQAADILAPVFPDRTVEIVPLRTRGDRVVGPLTNLGGKGLFTAELELGLREGRLDLAVHSAKDLPADMADDLTIAAVLPRADARDALVSRSDPLEELPRGAKVGTSSLRRAALLKAARPDLDISPLRGNVDTRIQKVLGDSATFDATVLAMAGLQRGGWLAEVGNHVYPLDVDHFPPAAGQGTLVIQSRAADAELLAALQPICHSETLHALQAERSVLRGLAATCHSCLAVYVYPESGPWRARAMAARADGSDMLRVEAKGPTARSAADTLLENLLVNGAKERLELSS
ncbi:MAG: hydroxymethylbilane synthase [Phycisphaerae bacterium]|nr:hydroxymethylbilane synthase [Phycisphaerae bacterium]